MATPRTQSHRYWIQIELLPNGTDTGAIQIDLNMVDKVSFTRRPTPEDPNAVAAVEIVYAGTMKSIQLRDNQAAWFMREWQKFAYIPNKMDKAEPGLIIPASHLKH